MNRYSWPQKIIVIVIGILIAIGLIVSISHLLLPILVFGAIFFLYKFPPNSWKYKRRESRSKNNRPKSTKKKNTRFRVIQGNKIDDNDDDKPKYH